MAAVAVEPDDYPLAVADVLMIGGSSLLATASGSKLITTGGKILLRARDLAWQPLSKHGLNVAYAPFWNDGAGNVPNVTADQRAQLSTYGVTFVRPTVNYYLVGGGVNAGTAPGAHFAVRNVQSIRPLAADPTKLEITCDGSTYAAPAGEQIALSAPLSYTDGTGTVTLPAQTLITLTGGTSGSVNADYTSAAVSTFVVAAGRTMIDVGAQSTGAGTTALHANFYRSGTTPRGQIAALVSAINKWLAAGFSIDYGGPHDNVYTLIASFGLTIVNSIRAQEFAYFASQNWPASKVLISAANEITWTGSAGTVWSNGYGNYFQYSLYPALRSAFPNHTLGFGSGFFDAVAALSGMTWWPTDSNTVLCLHSYLDGSGFTVQTGLTVDGTSAAAIQRCMDFVAGNAKRLGVGQVYFQEYGLQSTGITAAVRNTRLTALRQAILARGWMYSPWASATTPTDSYALAAFSNGCVIPSANGVGAFGLI